MTAPGTCHQPISSALAPLQSDTPQRTLHRGQDPAGAGAETSAQRTRFTSRNEPEQHQAERR
jgi:hypothetical protein